MEGFILLKILKWAELWIYFIENDEIRYGWGFILLKRNFLHWNCWSKVRLGIYSIKKDEIRYGWKFIEKVKVRYDSGLIHRKGQNRARLEICFIEHEKIRYGYGFISSKILKYFIPEGLFHSKFKNKVWLWIYSNEKSQNNLGFIPLKRLR